MSRQTQTDSKTPQTTPKQTVQRAPTGPTIAAQTPVATELQHAATNPTEARPAAVLSLQRNFGNRAIQKLVQTKLTVGAAGDRYEQEADQVAERVMRASNPQAAGAPGNPAQNGASGAKEETEGAALQMSGAAHQSGCGCPACSGAKLQRSLSSGGHGHSCSCGSCSGRIQRQPALVDQIHRAPDLQRADMRDSFEAGSSFESKLAGRSGGGTPLSSNVRRFMEPRFGADFSGVRLHTDKHSAGLNRDIHADAFTHGQNIFMGAGKFNPDSTGGKRLLAHELTHVVQQSGSQVKTQRAQRTLKRAPATIQRHSSWEHKALGDIEPDRLAILGTYQEMTDANKKAKKKAGLFGKVKPGQVTVDLGDPFNAPVSLETFMHVIDQEINRLKTFRDHPPTDASQKSADRLKMHFEERQARKDAEKEFGTTRIRQKTKEGFQQAYSNNLNQLQQDNTWQVRLLTINHRDKDTKELNGQKTIITYGEMNTLGDFVGDTGQLELIEQNHMQRIINGIRQQSMIRFMRVRDRVKGKNPNRKNYWGQGFKNTAGSTGRGPLVGDEGIGMEAFGKLGSESVGQLRLMLKDESMVPGVKESKYDAGLARNACHFAPESWITWDKYHRQAVRLAQLSIGARRNATRATAKNDPDKTKEKMALAERNMSKAILQNGFGDHFLQDSFAAGHLINKDEIMKWYQLWLANDSSWNAEVARLSQSGLLESDYAGGVNVKKEKGIGSGRRWDYMKNKTAKRNVAVVKGQQGLGVDPQRYDINNVGPGLQPKNMQGVENMGGDWQGRFQALGLQLPPSLRAGTVNNTIFKKWQNLIARNNKHIELTAPEFITAANIKPTAHNAVKAAFPEFAKEGMARSTGKRIIGANRGEVIYKLRQQYVLTGAKRTLKDKWKGQTRNPTDVTDNQDHEERSKKSVYKDYHMYMNNAALQASTNILHDHFCEKGLYVKAANGDEIGKVYGDDAMFKRESAKGVKYVGETSNMSRDSIYEMVNADPTQGIPAEPAGKTTADIKGRFPTQVTMADGSGAMSLANWHTQGPLKLLCERVIFPKANRNFWKTFIGGGKAAASTGLTEKISKDVSVHQGDLF